MSLAYLAFRNMVSKPLNLLLSLLLLVLSVSLVTFVLQFSKQLNRQLDKNIAPFDMVVGAKGSPLQLVLSSVLHVDDPTGNIPMEESEFLEKSPLVSEAIPVSYGDNHMGYRILGTTMGYLDKYNVSLSEGELFAKSFEVVVGSTVAKNLDLQLGSQFFGSHGLASNSIETHEDHPYTVTGILKSNGSVIDGLIITNLESVWESHDHDHEEQVGVDEEHHSKDVHDHKGEHDHDHEHVNEAHHHEEEDHEDREITAMLVTFRNPLAMVQLPRFINENTSMQAALPGFEIQRLMNLLGSGVKTINGIALAILLVSGLSIFISLLKTIRERRQELALLRTYGLSTFQLLGLVFLEGLFLTLLGFLLGWILGRAGIWAASFITQTNYGYGLEMNGPDTNEMILFALTILITILATLLASTSIFKLNISKTLSNA
ncbi:ABC transporter permease [Muricauda sp. 2012CJ35-5]|uniref:ABC transporter permease n=1 Tax=Flagellimonas spongiicola TaxID=2942208 RepID=A0ABT0PTB0_9FLAO|nr:FtsX-like permease family protein [Allomuricauda spongiicola]MCL6274623.1 ABC transporter permease [Allomuricauda spongiicola]